MRHSPSTAASHRMHPATCVFAGVDHVWKWLDFELGDVGGYSGTSPSFDAIQMMGDAVL
jgi:hypothetical protein